MTSVILAVKAANLLGETPLWDHRDRCLVWVDIEGRRINQLDPHKGNFRQFNPGQMVTALGLRASGGFIAATKNGFAGYSIDGNQLENITQVIQDNRETRFNDGTVDPAGNFWAGLYNNQRRAVSALYRLDPGLHVTSAQEGLIASNGIGWSPDGSWMYHTDTALRTIYVYDYDAASGTITGRRPLIEVPDEEDEGVPDGLAVDNQGVIWSARFRGGKIVGYDPSGKVISVIEVPTPNVTSCTFGGPDYDQLFITTARQRMDAPPADEYEGSLFVTTPGTRGMKANLYLG